MFSVLEVFSARRSSVYVYWLCQVLYISVYRCHCWQVCVTFCVVFSLLFSDVSIKKGYYILKFFIGVRNRDIMTEELSLICLYFVCCFLLVFVLHGIIYSMLIPCCLLNKDCFVWECFKHGCINQC